MEFGLIAVLFVPMMLGMFVVGMNLIRTISAKAAVSQMTDLYIHGADFSSNSMQLVAQRLANGLDLQFPTFTGNQATNTGTTGSGIIWVSQIMWVGSTTSPNCVAVGAANCTNHDSFVFNQRIMFGNSNLITTKDSTLGNPTCTGNTVSSFGTILGTNPITQACARLPTAGQTDMQGLWQSNLNNQTDLTDGQVVYIVEGYFQTNSFSLGNLSSGGIYVRFFY